MARCIVDSGFELTLWARRPESLEPYADTPATTAKTPAELGRVSDIVEICVVGDADVEDVLLRSDGVLEGMSAGGVVGSIRRSIPKPARVSPSMQHAAASASSTPR